MFSNNITLKATIAAEKEKEKTDNRLAARYLKIRALLDEAERAINAANIARILKNQLISKLMKARRALDKGLNVEEVIEMMTLIVTIINHHIKLDKKAIDLTTSEMRRDLDTFYKYDFDKFLRSETSSRQSQDRLTVCTPNTEAYRSRSRSREISNPRVWIRSPSEGTRQPREIEKAQHRSRSFGPRGSPVGHEKNLETVEEEDSKVHRKIGPANAAIEDESEDETAAAQLSSKPDKTGTGIDSLEEDEEELTEDPLRQHTLETLVTSLNILHEIPKLKLNKNQHNYLGPTMRATKPLLQTVKGCAALAGPLDLLKSAIESKIDGCPKEPLFTQALVEMNIVISSFEYAERKLAESKSYEGE